MEAPTKISFFEFLTPLITAGKKTITIRDKSESNYVPNTIVEVYNLEGGEYVCKIRIKSVNPLKFEEINEFHAEQESIELPKLKSLIRDIYPDIDDLYVIDFDLIA